MRSPRLCLLFASLLACAACSTAGAVPADLSALLAEAPPDVPARLWLDGDRIVGAAVAVGPGEVPADARRTAEAVQPRGERVFQGREWGPRGEGYRIDVHYAGDAGPEHSRSLLVTADGRVLERSHTVPIPDVPQHVLASAMQIAARIDEARIVSGPEHEEYWSVQVHDRSGRVWVVEVTLDGRIVRSLRRTPARVDG
ncbi:MAG: hypothetical protein JNM25_17925 [Planctomycetes bacterium]|nr:hypothetical protein [Planctomycetota bacterium]